MIDKSIDPLEQIFEEVKSSKDDNTLELFNDGQDDQIALRTDLINKEHVLVTALDEENRQIEKVLKVGIFDTFLESFKRHKVSLDRKSRTEFVQVNMKNTLDRDLNKLSNLKNLTDSRN